MIRLEHTEPGKFWEAWVQGTALTLRYTYNSGTKSQTQTFATPEAAQKDLDKRVRKKLRRGYHEAGQPQAKEAQFDTPRVSKFEAIQGAGTARKPKANDTWIACARAKPEERVRRGLSTSRDGTVVTTGKDGRAIVWSPELVPHSALSVRNKGSREPLPGEAVAISEDGAWIATSFGRCVQLWDVAKRRLRFASEGFPSALQHLQFVAGGSVLVAVSRHEADGHAHRIEARIVAFDVATQKVLGKTPLEGKFSTLTQSEDRVVVLSNTHAMTLTFPALEPLKATTAHHGSYVSALAPKGDVVARFGRANRVEFHDLIRGVQHTQTITLSERPGRMVYLPKTSILAVYLDKHLLFFQTQTGEELARLNIGVCRHLSLTSSARVITAGAQGRLRAWSLEGLWAQPPETKPKVGNEETNRRLEALRMALGSDKTHSVMWEEMCAQLEASSNTLNLELEYAEAHLSGWNPEDRTAPKAWVEAVFEGRPCPMMRLVRRINHRQHVHIEGLRLMAACSDLDNLVVLELAESPLGDEAASIIADGPWLSTLEVLALDDIGLGPKGVARLLEAPWPKLRHIDVSRNRIGAKGATALVNTSQIKNLEALIFSDAGFTSKTFAKSLAEYDQLGRFKELAIDGNKLNNLNAFLGSKQLGHLERLTVTLRTIDELKALCGNTALTNLKHLDLKFAVNLEHAKLLEQSTFLPNLENLVLPRLRFSYALNAQLYLLASPHVGQQAKDALRANFRGWTNNTLNVFFREAKVPDTYKLALLDDKLITPASLDLFLSWPRLPEFLREACCAKIK